MRRWLTLLLPFAAFSAGCFEPPQNLGPVQADVIVEDDTDFEALWEMTLRVLNRAKFTPDRRDRREGVITTKPITCQQWFEFWRHDAMGPYQWLESSMHTIQRLAVVRIVPKPDPGRYRVSVRVDVFRYSAPERQVTTPSGALLMYSEKFPTESGEMIVPQEVLHWVRLGRDPHMEGALLRRILNHYPGTHELIGEPAEDAWPDEGDEVAEGDGVAEEPEKDHHPHDAGTAAQAPIRPTRPKPVVVSPPKDKSAWKASPEPEVVGPPAPSR